MMLGQIRELEAMVFLPECENPSTALAVQSIAGICASGAGDRCLSYDGEDRGSENSGSKWCKDGPRRI